MGTLQSIHKFTTLTAAFQVHCVRQFPQILLL